MSTLGDVGTGEHGDNEHSTGHQEIPKNTLDAFVIRRQGLFVRPYFQRD
jgi:hypothetical protein